MAKRTAYILNPTEGGVPIKSWTRGVALEDAARKQLQNVARLPFIHNWVAAMPDVHLGYGATVGSVIPTHEAIIPAAVGVDIGCGMIASRTTLTAADLPDDLRGMRNTIERAVPHGRTHHGGRNDKGAFRDMPAPHERAWKRMRPGYQAILDKHPSLDRGQTERQLGTLGTGNHFIEVCLDQDDRVWFMLHSGSRGVGNRIGQHFISLAKKEMERHDIHLPDKDLAYLKEGSVSFDDYVDAVGWAQRFARVNRDLMMDAVIEAVSRLKGIKPFTMEAEAVNCHHNYVEREHHYGKDVWLTRKGAVRAGKDDLGIIPGSMGTRSFIVRGKGNPESFESCSHGAGRAMSRTAARKRFTVADHEKATRGVECRKDAGVIDETPAAYKSIDDVMRAQSDLVSIVHTLRQVVCVKG